jgi:hypothetical protein
VGVGRKMTYDITLEEELLMYAMIEREKEEGVSIKKLKGKVLSMVKAKKLNSDRHFKGSDGWATKFCVRNSFDVGDAFKCPKLFPK